MCELLHFVCLVLLWFFKLIYLPLFVFKYGVYGSLLITEQGIGFGYCHVAIIY